LTADKQRIAANLERVGDRKIDAGLDPLRGIAGIRLPGRIWTLPSPLANGLLEPTSQSVKGIARPRRIAGVQIHCGRFQSDFSSMPWRRVEPTFWK